MEISLAINIASGVGLVALGIGLFAKSRARSAPLFAGFCVLWGGAVVVLNFAVPAVGAREMVLGLAGLALLIPQPFLLLSFASRLPPARHAWLPVAPGAFGLIVGLWFAVDPSRFKEPGDLNTAWGALLISAPQQLAIAAALLIVLTRWRVETSQRLATEAAIVAFGLLTYLAYLAGHWAPEQFRLAIQQPSAEWYVQAATFGAITIAVAGAIRILVRERARPLARRLLAAALIALAVGLVVRLMLWRVGQLAPITSPLPGLIRLAAAAVIVYAILKHQVFDIDLRIKRGIPPTVLAAIPVVGFFLVSQLVEFFVESRTSSTLIAIVVAGALFVLEARVVRVGRRLSERLLPHVGSTPDYLASRRLEIYRAALDSARADGQITEGERRVLATLREDLGIRDEEAEAI